MGAVPVAQHMSADEFLRLPDTGDTLTSPQLDGFELPLVELFPE
jgi:hypothetical protein